MACIPRTYCDYDPFSWEPRLRPDERKRGARRVWLPKAMGGRGLPGVGVDEIDIPLMYCDKHEMRDPAEFLPGTVPECAHHCGETLDPEEGDAPKRLVHVKAFTDGLLAKSARMASRRLNRPVRCLCRATKRENGLHITVINKGKPGEKVEKHTEMGAEPYPPPQLSAAPAPQGAEAAQRGRDEGGAAAAPGPLAAPKHSGGGSAARGAAPRLEEAAARRVQELLLEQERNVTRQAVIERLHVDFLEGAKTWGLGSVWLRCWHQGCRAPFAPHPHALAVTGAVTLLQAGRARRRLSWGGSRHASAGCYDAHGLCAACSVGSLRPGGAWLSLPAAPFPLQQMKNSVDTVEAGLELHRSDVQRCRDILCRGFQARLRPQRAGSAVAGAPTGRGVAPQDDRGNELGRELRQGFQKLRVALAPWLHGNKYSSYGRHFTKPAKLEEVNKRCMFFLTHGDCIVDFSCGANDWVPMLLLKAQQAGLRVRNRLSISPTRSQQRRLGF